MSQNKFTILIALSILTSCATVRQTISVQAYVTTISIDTVCHRRSVKLETSKTHILYQDGVDSLMVTNLRFVGPSQAEGLQGGWCLVQTGTMKKEPWFFLYRDDSRVIVVGSSCYAN